MTDLRGEMSDMFGIRVCIDASPHPRLISCNSGIGPLADHAGTRLMTFTLLDLNLNLNLNRGEKVKSSPVPSKSPRLFAWPSGRLVD